MNLIDDPDFLAALTEAETQQKKPRAKPPTRFAARALLVPLGEVLLESGDDVAAAAGALQRVRALFDGNRDGWAAAVRDDLTLAVTEHVRSCDPRYLKLPNYDFPYTVAARHRLEARLRAAAELECPVDEVLLEQVERADRELAPHLERDGRSAGPTGSTPPSSRPRA